MKGVLTLLVVLVAVTQHFEADAREKSHGLSYFGDLKYPADFRHFDYVNPNAPKGGSMRTVGRGNFDSLNGFIRKGTAAVGLVGTSSTIYDRLMVDSDDEPSSLYGLIAKSVELADDFTWVKFELRPEARWHDNVPLTVDDVIFTFETLKEYGRPTTRAQLRDVESAKRTGPHEVTFYLKNYHSPKLAQYVARLYIIPKHYWETRSFDETTREFPLGSGPYRIADMQLGRWIKYERVKDYWARDLPVNVGRYNFDEVRYESFGNEQVTLEAHKAGLIDAESILVSKIWAVDLEFPALEEGVFIKRLIKTKRPSGMIYGIMFNMRLPQFQSLKLREALSYAYDFEWSNRVLYQDFYERIDSFFMNSDLASSGTLPSEKELALLEPYRDKVPPRVFTDVYRPAVTGGVGVPRANLKKADQLLRDAGWIVNDEGVRVNRETGKPLTIDFITVSIYLERSTLPFINNLEKLGIKSQIRSIEASQYTNRAGRYDIEGIIQTYPQTALPGVELRSYWGSDSGKHYYSRNLAGIDDPVVDALIVKVISARTYPDLVAAGRALDRVMLWNYYAIPGYYPPGYRYAYWDKFDFPRTTEEMYRSGFFDLWWQDNDKAARVAAYQSQPSSGTGE